MIQSSSWRRDQGAPAPKRTCKLPLEGRAVTRQMLDNETAWWPVRFVKWSSIIHLILFRGFPLAETSSTPGMSTPRNDFSEGCLKRNIGAKEPIYACINLQDILGVPIVADFFDFHFPEYVPVWSLGARHCSSVIPVVQSLLKYAIRPLEMDENQSLHYPAVS